MLQPLFLGICIATCSEIKCCNLFSLLRHELNNNVQKYTFYHRPSSQQTQALIAASFKLLFMLFFKDMTFSTDRASDWTVPLIISYLLLILFYTDLDWDITCTIYVIHLLSCQTKLLALSLKGIFVSKCLNVSSAWSWLQLNSAAIRMID